MIKKINKTTDFLKVIYTSQPRQTKVQNELGQFLCLPGLPPYFPLLPPPHRRCWNESVSSIHRCSCTAPWVIVGSIINYWSTTIFEFSSFITLGSVLDWKGLKWCRLSFNTGSTIYYLWSRENCLTCLSLRILICMGLNYSCSIPRSLLPELSLSRARPSETGGGKGLGTALLQALPLLLQVNSPRSLNSTPSQGPRPLHPRSDREWSQVPRLWGQISPHLTCCFYCCEKLTLHPPQQRP